jgi:hypothetical protein
MMNSARMLRAELPVQRKSNLNFGFVGSILAAGFLADGLVDPAGAFLDPGQSAQVVAKEFVGGNAVLKALEIGLQFVGWLCREAVDDPGAFACGLDHLTLPQVGEVLGDLRLGNLENVLKMTDA